MQTNFSLTQLADPDIAVANEILRKCVHCGFCTATCPTYVLLGDELDSPRGRIYLIKDMLENDKPASETLVTHVDRCLTCLSCMTTCPSGVHYMHLVDQARARIEKTFTRPWPDRLARDLLAWLLPRPGLFRLALLAAWPMRPLADLFKGRWARGRQWAERMGAMLAMAPGKLPPPSALDRLTVFPAWGERRKRVALLTGCAQRVLTPRINEATIRLLNRLGCEVAVPRASGCCGALAHHMGRKGKAHAAAKANIAAWIAERDGAGLDAVVINASGCGTAVKDYGFMLREDAEWAERAAAVSAMTVDVTELLDTLGMPDARAPEPITVAYHSACSMQHGQKLTRQPKALLGNAGFAVRDVPEGHLCCGSAGTYNLLQPAIADRLRDRKVANIESVAPDVVATGNIGCAMQIGGAIGLPVVHTVELLDWATGGPRPEGL